MLWPVPAPFAAISYLSLSNENASKNPAGAHLSITGDAKNEELGREPHGMPGFPGVVSAGHSSMKDGNGESGHSGAVGNSKSLRPIPTSSNF